MPEKTGSRWLGPLRGGRGARQQPAEVGAADFLGLVGTAIRDGQACLLALSPDGPVPPADDAAMCGWGPSDDGSAQTSGTCIGYISAATAGERRVHLWPPLAYAAAAWASACSGAVMPDSLPQVSAALLDAGLVSCRAGARAPGRGRADAAPEVWRFWDLPASALLAQAPAGRPAPDPAAGFELGD
jgi:hypothetical protein